MNLPGTQWMPLVFVEEESENLIFILKTIT